jgi:hypothetical protein
MEHTRNVSGLYEDTLGALKQTKATAATILRMHKSLDKGPRTVDM